MGMGKHTDTDGNRGYRATITALQTQEMSDSGPASQSAHSVSSGLELRPQGQPGRSRVADVDEADVDVVITRHRNGDSNDDNESNGENDYQNLSGGSTATQMAASEPISTEGEVEEEVAEEEEADDDDDKEVEEEEEEEEEGGEDSSVATQIMADTSEETRQISESSSEHYKDEVNTSNCEQSDHTAHSDTTADYTRKDTLTANTLVEKHLADLALDTHELTGATADAIEDNVSDHEAHETDSRSDDKIIDAQPSEFANKISIRDPILPSQQQPLVHHQLKVEPELQPQPKVKPELQPQPPKPTQPLSQPEGGHFQHPPPPQASLQRQLYDQSLEEKKMEQFRKLNQLNGKEQKNFAKSMSPMSPKTTVPFTRKLNQNGRSNPHNTNVHHPLPLNQNIGNGNGNGNGHGNTQNYRNVTGGRSLLSESFSSHHKLQAQAIHTFKEPQFQGSSSSQKMSNINDSNSSNGNGNGNSNVNNPNVNSISKPQPSSPAENHVKRTTTFASPAATTQPNNSHQSAISVAVPERTTSPFRDPSNMYVKQINDQQRPMYTPAVLRVTKNTPSPSAIDSCSGFDVHSKPERPDMKSTNSNASIRSTASSIADYWNYVTGRSHSGTPYDGPTRQHWKPDSTRFNCAQCGRVFNYLTEKRRKHHCRSCGDIFCGDCLRNYIYLDEHAKFTLFGSTWDDDGDDKKNDNRNSTTNTNTHADASNNIINNDKKYLCKVCVRCFKQYEEYVLDHTTRDHNLGANGKDLHKTKTDERDSNVDGSNIPVDWDWSSF
jgi:hypothetical protein